MDIENFGRPPEHELAKPVRDMIYLKYHMTPRNRQRELGPSEIGEPCERRLALNLMNEPSVNDGDPLPSIVGTAAHTWMEDACRVWNKMTGRMDWIPELTLNSDGVIGHSDAYHVPTESVVDWKFPGREPMKEYRDANYVGPLYEVQGHTYGKGWAALGLPVKNIVVVMLPRGGRLHGKYGMFIWSAPFDPSIADRGMERYFRITEKCMELDVENHPERYAQFEAKRGPKCQNCDWFRPGKDDGNVCGGFSVEKKGK